MTSSVPGPRIGVWMRVLSAGRRLVCRNSQVCTGWEPVVDELSKFEVNIRLYLRVDLVKVRVNIGGSFYAFPYLVHYKTRFKVSRPVSPLD